MCVRALFSNYITTRHLSNIYIHVEFCDQGSGTAAAYADSPQEILSAHPLSSAQQLQRENVAEIVKTNNLELLRDFGGVRGVADALNTDLQNGIPIPHQTCLRNPTLLYQFLLIFFHSFLQSCNNLTVFLLSCATVLSLWFGIKEDGPHMGWLNGGILLATVLLIMTGTTVRTCWEKWRSNKTQSAAGRMLKVKVVRGGCLHTVGEADLVVGDIARVQEGDQIPADGLFVGSDHDHEALRLDDGSTIDEHSNPFMFYGYKVMSGEGRMLVTSTGMDTGWGEMMIRAANKECNFECYLNRLFVYVHLSGLLISILIIVVLFRRYHAGKLDDERRYRPESKGEPTQLKVFVNALKAIITGSKGTARVVTTLLSVSLLGITEGAPFLISVSILMWSRKTLACKALERDSFACVNMARLTTICTDMSGALIEQEVGLIHRLYVGEGFVSEVSNLASQLVEALCDVIVAPSLLGDPEVDDSLVSWAESVLGMDRNLIQQSKEIGHNTLNQPNLQLIMDKNGNRGILHCKGPPDQILSMCTHHYNIDGQILELDGQKKSNLEREIGHMVAEDSQVTAYACKHIQDSNHEVSHHQQQQNDLTFLAVMSMSKKTKMEAIKVSVSGLKEERVRAILASGEDVSVLNPIAQKCGLLTTHDLNTDDLVLTGEEFRRLEDAERKNKIGNICIIGNCSPDDKFLLVKCLKETGQVVALVAHTTVDAPALKLADMGITYQGNCSSEIIRECSDITLLDDNLCCFGFLLNAIKSGRCFLENIRKFIQLQLIFAISSSLINFTATVALGDAPITAVQLFWLNLVVALVGGLALLTGSGSGVAPPIESSSEKLITREMWRNIGVQVCYQTSVFVGVQHMGEDILGTSGDRVKLAIYNAFFLCQMVNIFIAAQPRKMNIFSGLFHKSRCFWAALLLFIISQAGFAAAEEFIRGGPGLSLKLWGECLLIAFLCWPLDLACYS